MKNNKRLLALVLALVLTVSCFPVSIFAVGEPAPQSAPDQVVYDFDLLNQFNQLTGSGYFDVEDQADTIRGLYNAGSVNWIYEGKGVVDGGNGSFTRNQFNKNVGIRVYASNHDWWYAIRVKAPGTGNYNVSVNSYTATSGGVQKHSNWTEVYLFDAAPIDAETATIAGSMTAENKLANNFAPLSAQPDVQLGAFAFTEGKEYILVFRETLELYRAANADSLRTNNLYLSSITMDKTTDVPPETSTTPQETTTVPPETTTTPQETTTPDAVVIPPDAPEAGYNFDLKTLYDEIVVGNTSVQDPQNVALTDALYAAGKLNWLFETYQNGVDSKGNPVESFIQNKYSKGAGIEIRTTGYDWWYALRIKAPGTGTYDVTINTNLVNSSGVKKHSMWTETYIFDAAKVTGSTTINDLLIKENKYNTFAPTSAEPSTYIGNVAFTEGKDYIIVLKITDETRAQANEDGLRTNNLYLKNMEFVEAEPPVVEVPKADYNFDLLNIYKDGTFTTDLDAITTQKATLREYFDKGYTKWAFEAFQNGVDSKGNPVESFIQNKFSKGAGIEIRTTGYDWWYAIRVKAPGTGTYDVTINTNLVNSSGVKKHSMWTETYIFDAAKVTGSTTINDLLVKENKCKTFAPTTENPAAYVGNVAFTEGKDYIIVLKITDDTRSQANEDGLRTNNLYLKSIEFVAAEPPVVEIPKTGYDFNLVSNYPEDFTVGEIEDQLKLIQEYYKKGYISWCFMGKNPASKTSKATFSRNRLVKGDGIQVLSSNYDWYYAIRFRSPGKGAHKVEIDTLLANAKDANGNPIKKHSVWTNVYIVEASQLDNGKTTITDCLLKRNLVGECQPTPEKPLAEVGYYEFEADKEYVMILRQTRNTYSQGKDATGLTTNNLYLNSLKFTYTANPPKKVVDTSKVVYDFDLADKKTGIYEEAYYINDRIDDLSRLYALDEINWKLAAPGGSDARFKATGGISSYGKADDYIAFKIKSPGKGLYTLSLNHGKSGRGAVGAVYILPADTEDILFGMDNHNRVGKLEFHNDTGDVALKDGFTSVLGTWEFGSASEYIVVVEAFETSPYAEQAYMYFSQLICERGDKTASSQAKRAPHSVVVDPSPVKLMEVCTYQAVAEINGDDYLFLPMEGKKLAVYNLDKKTLVDYTDTTLGQTKGIAVDKDGIVWMVGDNPNIFRYDPYLNVGKSVYAYKNMSTESVPDKIKNANVGFGLAIGDDGCIYFGVYTAGHLAKYNTVTGEFTDMGPVGASADSLCYACYPVYDNGYVYVTTTGDTNGDGVKTFELAKYEASSGKLVKRMDISQYFSQQEVMVRAMGICNGVLLFGGERNDIKQAVALDAETFEFVDIGVAGSIGYGPTAVRDGKVWFVAYGLGMFEYDGATRKATPVPGLENVSAGIRMGNNCFVTIENNDLFPGESIMYYRTSTNEPVVFNVTTGKTMILENVIQEEYGSTSNIRPLLKVPGETNEIYIGSFNTAMCSVFDVQQGKIVNEFETYGQTDSILVYDGNLYVGNYNRGILTQINTEDKNRNVPLLSLKTEYKQSRIHAITGGGGKVFIGSIPDRYELGGCLAWVDVETLEKHVVRNVVQDQSVVALAYHDSGYILGGTCVSGGSGSVSKADASAKFFIYDVAKKEKVAEYDLRDYFKNSLPEKIEGIDGMITDENGRVWMVCEGNLFSFTFDAEKKTIDIRKELSYGFSTADWFPTAMLIEDGYLYANLGKSGGVRKINISNPSDNTRVPIPATDYFALGNDGNIYYTQGKAALLMYPMSVTEADRAAAEKIDAQLADLKDIKLDSEQAILDARAAYEALSWTEKSMVYNLDKLVAAEIDLLECKIDALGAITLDDETAILAIKETYNTLSAKNKTYVKNYYTVFIPALQALQELIDQREAARVQVLIDTIPGLGEITLDKEAAIREIETAYNALTKQQRALVDAKYLEDALAKIYALRQEKIKYLNTLIANFGDITLEDEPAINEAREIFDWLTMTEREQVDFVALTTADSALKKLQKAAAAEVDALIEAIGDSVNYNSGKAIEAARTAYDALTPGSKEYVKQISILEEAEALYSALFPIWAIIVIVAAIVVGGGTATIVYLKKKKASAKTGA